VVAFFKNCEGLGRIAIMEGATVVMLGKVIDAVADDGKPPEDPKTAAKDAKAAAGATPKPAGGTGAPAKPQGGAAAPAKPQGAAAAPAKPQGAAAAKPAAAKPPPAKK